MWLALTDATPSNGCMYALPAGFAFENYDQAGLGPESLRAFVDACLGRPHFVGADAHVGLQVVRAIDAMYRSAKSGAVEMSWAAGMLALAPLLLLNAIRERPPKIEHCPSPLFL